MLVGAVPRDVLLRTASAMTTSCSTESPAAAPPSLSPVGDSAVVVDVIDADTVDYHHQQPLHAPAAGTETADTDRGSAVSSPVAGDHSVDDRHHHAADGRS